MRPRPILVASLLVLDVALPARGAEITDVIDAFDADDPFDINIDVLFRSTLNRSKITHEWSLAWQRPDQYNRPDYNELRFEEQIYTMDYMIEIGLLNDLQLTVTLPWIISDTRTIHYVSGVVGENASPPDTVLSTLYRDNPGADFQNALAVDPGDNPSTTRAGFGDMTLGIKWAAFNDERDDTKSVWVLGFDYTIPTGRLALPEQVVGGSEGGVGLGHHVLSPYMLFSHRFSVLDPYMGLRANLPIQGSGAADAGLRIPISGGFLSGMEIVPWESVNKLMKVALDVRLWFDYFSEVESIGRSGSQGTVNELSDFLVSPSAANPERQLQATGQYAQFGLLLGFAIRMTDYFRLRLGVSLAHNTEHFLTGADPCEDKDGDGLCTAEGTQPYYSDIYDRPGVRIRVEETTLFNYWVTAMGTF